MAAAAQTMNIHEAKTHLSRLVADVEAGGEVVIARAGKPVVKLVRVDAKSPRRLPRLGGLEGQFIVPDDFDTMFAGEIRAMFEDGPLFPPETPDA